MHSANTILRKKDILKSIDGGAGLTNFPIQAWGTTSVSMQPSSATSNGNTNQSTNTRMFEKIDPTTIKNVIDSISDNLFDVVELNYDENGDAIIEFHENLQLYKNYINNYYEGVVHNNRFEVFTKSIQNVISNENKSYKQIIDNWGGFKSYLYDADKMNDIIINQYIKILLYISELGR